MSSSTHQPATPEREGSFWQTARDEKWLFVGLLIAAGLIVGATGNWFLGHLALTAVIAVPTFRWFTMRNESTRGKTLRLSARLTLAGFTLVTLIVGGISDGFESGVMYACIIYLITGFGWVKREVLLSILISVSVLAFAMPDLVVPEAVNSVIYMAVLFITAMGLGKQWKLDAINRKARLANLFVERNLPQDHPVRSPFEAPDSAYGRTPGDAYDSTFFGHPARQPYQGGRTGMPEGYLGYPPATGRVPMPPLPDEEDRTVDLTGERRPRWADEEDPTSTHTVVPGFAPEPTRPDGPPVRRRIIPEGDERPKA